MNIQAQFFEQVRNVPLESAIVVVCRVDVGLRASTTAISRAITVSDYDALICAPCTEESLQLSTRDYAPSDN